LFEQIFPSTLIVIDKLSRSCPFRRCCRHQTHDDLVVYHFDAEEVWLGIHCVQPQLSSLSELSCAASGGDDLITGFAYRVSRGGYSRTSEEEIAMPLTRLKDEYLDQDGVLLMEDEAGAARKE
jgi:hypothetical protein